MKHVKALLIKFIFTLLVLLLVLGAIYNMTYGNIFFISIIITGTGYVLGDLYVLPRFENWGAIISDFLLVVAVIYFYGTIFLVTPFSLLNAAAITAIILSIGEFFFHKYVDMRILRPVDTSRTKEKTNIDVKRLQTEMSEEMSSLHQRENTRDNMEKQDD